MCSKLLTFIFVLVVLAGITNAEQVDQTASDPIHWWRLDDGAGLDATDSGTVGGLTGLLETEPNVPLWVSGMVGGALDFGDPDYGAVEISGQPTIGTNRITVSAWIKAREWDVTLTGVASAILGTRSTTPENNGWDIVVDESLTDPNLGALIFVVSGGQAVWHTVKTDPVMTLNTWYHIAVTYDGTWVTLYIDGNYSHSVALTLDVSLAGTRTRIGRAPFAPDRPFRGTIDDVRIYNRALSANALRGLFLNTRPDVGQAWEPNPYPEAGGAALGTDLEWLPGDYAAEHDVYFGTNFNDVNDANTNDSQFKGNQAGTTYSSLPTLTLDTQYYWRIDEVNDACAPNLWKGSVWSFTTEDGAAFGPTPASGSTVTDLRNVLLTWEPGGYQDVSNGHEVYFGTNFNEVADANRTVHPNVTYVVRSAPNYGPLVNLEVSKAYYWRVDEFKSPDTTWPGPVWSFATPDYLLVDDFESYGNIFSNWSAGFGGTLAIEDTIVNNGDQSMSFSYSDYSKVERVPPFTDWASEGIKALVISLHGDISNQVEEVFVALTDSDSDAVV